MKKVNIHSLKVKLVLFLCMLFSLFIILIIFDSIIMSNTIRREINLSVLKSVNSTDTYLSFFFNKAKDISKNISADVTLDNDLKRYFNNPELYQNNAYEKYRVSDDLSQKIMYISQLNENLDSIYIYSDSQQEVITSIYGVYPYNDISISQNLDVVHNAEGVYNWLRCYDEISKRDLVKLVSRANIINRDIKSNVYISVNFNVKTISDFIKGLQLTQNTLVYLIDQHGSIIAADNDYPPGTDINTVLNTNLQSFDINKPKRVKLSQKGYYQEIYKKNEITNWGILVLIPENELLSEEKGFWYMNISLILIEFFILLFLSLKIIERYVNKPVKKLVFYMKEAENGNFDERIQPGSKDEFSYLFKAYNIMVKKIKGLIQELYEEKLLKKEAELKMLQEQINPHFLYNTLDSINWMAKANNVDEISNIVVSLSDYYRTIFNKGRNYINVAQMMDSVRDYLYIYKFRFKDMLNYEVQTVGEIADIYLLNFLLQPIVENALVHGIDKKNGFVKVTCKLEDELLHFYVEDNGKGMSEEKLKLLLASLKNQSNTTDSGLRNVYKRIKLFYGEQYGLDIKSGPDYGTCVEMVIPALKGVQEESALK